MLNKQYWGVKSMPIVYKCPICTGYANSKHHIKPLRAGGTDEPRNRVRLCEPCHDIVELIYDEYGIEYSPALVHTIRREFNITYNMYSRKTLAVKRKVKQAKEYQPSDKRLCKYCGKRFKPKQDGQVLCGRCIENVTYIMYGRLLGIFTRKALFKRTFKLLLEPNNKGR